MHIPYDLTNLFLGYIAKRNFHTGPKNVFKMFTAGYVSGSSWSCAGNNLVGCAQWPELGHPSLGQGVS